MPFRFNSLIFWCSGPDLCHAVWCGLSPHVCPFWRCHQVMYTITLFVFDYTYIYVCVNNATPKFLRIGYTVYFKLSLKYFHQILCFAKFKNI